MEQKLIDMGFSAKESKVYVALLEIGGAPISAIAKKAGINRTTTYDIIASLSREKLIHRVLGSKKEMYAAAPPEKLPLVFEARMKDMALKAERAKKMVSELQLLASKAPGKPRVSIYEGVKGVKDLYEDSLLSKETIRSFSSTESLESFDQKHLHDYYKRRASKGISIKAIINDIPTAHEYRKQDKKLNREIRIVPKEKMDIGPEVYIYNQKVAIFSLREKYGVLIESKDISQALKKLYDLAWDHAGEIDTQNMK